MVRTVEKFHSFKFCPKCKADVEVHHRFCRQCTFWLARPEQDKLRTIAVGQANRAWGDGLLQAFQNLRDYQASFYIVLFGASLGGIGVLVLILLLNYYAPEWGSYGPRAQQRACYSNMRVIQGAMEIYLQDNRFTPALGSDPVDVLFQSGSLNNRPVCPLKGNLYKIPRRSGLQCVGSEGHGLPN